VWESYPEEEPLPGGWIGLIAENIRQGRGGATVVSGPMLVDFESDLSSWDVVRHSPIAWR
tara:strand:+ start:1445 stop:1624 length:180 start_codon:yes stop_codon:yes gene_type:complete